MNDKSLLEAKKLLKDGSDDSIASLEALLDSEGFREKIRPSDLTYAPWYGQHITREPYDRTNYLVPYEHGFIRKNPTTESIAAYGIIKEIDLNAQMYPKFKPQHFFFMDQITEQLDGMELLDYLVQKAHKSPKNPARTDARLQKIEAPVPGGSMPLNISIFAIELLTGNILAQYVPQIEAIYQSTNASLIAGAGLFFLNSMIVRSNPARKLLKKLGYEDYDAPASSSILSKDYGIQGLERYAYMFPDRN